jgi:acyl carrier protein
MFDQLAEIITNYVEVKKEDIKPESRFMEDLGFSSFDFMSMLGEVEDTFDVEIEEEKAAGIRTVQEAVDYLEQCEGKH